MNYVVSTRLDWIESRETSDLLFLCILLKSINMKYCTATFFILLHLLSCSQSKIEAPVYIKSLEKGKTLKQSLKELDRLTVVVFYVDWGEPSRMYKPVLSDSYAKLKSFNLFLLNANDNEEIATEFGVRSVPATYFFKKGVQIGEPIIGAINPQKFEENIIKLN